MPFLPTASSGASWHHFVKELIVLGILASRGLQYGVAAHMRRALDYGATKDE